MEVQEVKEQLKSIFRQVINNDKWITIHPNGEDEKGRHLLLKDGESPKEAIDRVYKKKDKNEDNPKAQYTYDMPNGDKIQKLLDEKHKLEDDFSKSKDKSSIIERKEEIDKEIEKLKSDTKDNVSWKDKDYTNVSDDELREKLYDITQKLDKKHGSFENAPYSEKEEYYFYNNMLNKGYRSKGNNPDIKDGKDLYSDENFKENAKRLNEQFWEKPYSEWQKDVQTMLKKYGKTEEDWDNAIGARKDAFKQSDSKGEKVADTKILQGGVKESHDEYGRTIFSKKDSNKKVKIHKNGNFYLASYGQELKNDDGYTEFQVFPSASGKSFKTEEGARKWALKQLKADNSKENDMSILEDLKKLIAKVENGKESDMEKIENEKVDKRKLIDEVAGMMKSAGCDDEVIRTAIGKMEKLSYDKSEADTAHNEKEDEKAENCDKKVKNKEEKDEKEVKEVKEDVKEDVENKCKNSVDNSKVDYFAKLNEIYNAASKVKDEVEYISQADREKAAEDYFAK